MKLQACGFYGNVLLLLISYLENRQQFVEVNGEKSKFCVLWSPSGIPFRARTVFDLC